MAILKVARLGHPVLRERAEPVPEARSAPPRPSASSTTWSRPCASTTARASPRNQVHTLQQIAVIEVHGNPRYPDAPSIPLTVVINPVVTPLTEEMEEGWEGCLSVPDMRGRVPRYTAVRLEASTATASGSISWPRSSSRASSSTRPTTSRHRLRRPHARSLHPHPHRRVEQALARHPGAGRLARPADAAPAGPRGARWSRISSSWRVSAETARLAGGAPRVRADARRARRRSSRIRRAWCSIDLTGGLDYEAIFTTLDGAQPRSPVLAFTTHALARRPSPGMRGATASSPRRP